MDETSGGVDPWLEFCAAWNAACDKDDAPKPPVEGPPGKYWDRKLKTPPTIHRASTPVVAEEDE